MRVLYIVRDNEFQWKITDFAFSSQVGTCVPRSINYWKLPRNYSAPELLITAQSNTKSDIWSAACILFEVATGQPVFNSEEAIRKFAWLGVAPPLVSNTRSDLTRDIDDNIERMLKTSPNARPEASTILKKYYKSHNSEKPTRNPILEISKHDIHPSTTLDTTSLGANRFFATIKAERVIVESHVLHNILKLDLLDHVRQLTQLVNSLQSNPNCSVFSCLGFVHNSDTEYSLIFQIPQSITTLDSSFSTLETVLSSPAHPVHEFLKLPLHKVRFAATLAWTIYSIHNAGYLHRAIGSHNILIGSTPDPCPFVVGFDIETTQPLAVNTMQIIPSFEWRDRLYQHPDFQSERNYSFRREYDFYSFGVVMLELARMVSFAQFSGDRKQELENMSGERLQLFRIQKAKELKPVVGEEYVRIMTSCLTVTVEQNRVEEGGKRFEEEICTSLKHLMSNL